LNPFLQYSKKYIDELLPTVKIVPAAIQLEIHPQLPQSDITAYAKEKGIHVIAYSPLGSTGSPVASIEPVVKLAEKKGVTPVSILLSHHGESFFAFPVMKSATNMCRLSCPWQHRPGQVCQRGPNQGQQGARRDCSRGAQGAGRLDERDGG
jgi:hypothetical protein